MKDSSSTPGYGGVTEVVKVLGLQCHRGDETVVNILLLKKGHKIFTATGYRNRMFFFVVV